MLCTLVSLIIKQAVIIEQGGNFIKINNSTGFNNQAGWTFNQVLTFEQASIIKQGGNFINLKCQKRNLNAHGFIHFTGTSRIA